MVTTTILTNVSRESIGAADSWLSLEEQDNEVQRVARRMAKFLSRALRTPVTTSVRWDGSIDLVADGYVDTNDEFVKDCLSDAYDSAV